MQELDVLVKAIFKERKGEGEAKRSIAEIRLRMNDYLAALARQEAETKAKRSWRQRVKGWFK